MSLDSKRSAVEPERKGKVSLRSCFLISRRRDAERERNTTIAKGESCFSQIGALKYDDSERRVLLFSNRSVEIRR